MAEQKILSPENGYSELTAYLRAIGVRHLLVVHDGAYPHLQVQSVIERLPETCGIAVTTFSDLQPNPRYASIEAGVRLFREAGCDAVLAVGGGSAMDVAKCGKLYADMEPGDIPFVKREVTANRIPLLAVPTTAGTGSEATRFAVIYLNGVKQSVAHDSILPEAVLMDASVLDTLPDYQRRATMLDALSHAVESFWNVNSTEESQRYAAEAIGDVLRYQDGYLCNEPEANSGMLWAAHKAGQAINLTKTTAGHAMCYKITSLYGAAHGHAAALVNRKLWPWTLRHLDRCIDPRGEAYLKDAFDRLAAAMGYSTAEAAAQRFSDLYDELGLPVPRAKAEDFPVLCASVNPERLKNHPVALTSEDIEALYHEILCENTEKVD